MTYWVKFAFSAVLNILIALFGTAVVETPLTHRIPGHSIGQILLRTYVCDTIVAAVLGYFAYRISEAKAAKWVWTAGAGWFLSRVLVSAASTHYLSLSNFSGADCSIGIEAAGCHNWFLFTFPALRLTAFSLGATVCYKLNHKGSHPVFDAARVRFKPINFDAHK